MNDEVTLDEAPELITTKDVAQLCQISKRQVFRIKKKGLLRERARVGNAIIYTPESVLDLLRHYRSKQWYRLLRSPPSGGVRGFRLQV